MHHHILKQVKSNLMFLGVVVPICSVSRETAAIKFTGYLVFLVKHMMYPILKTSQPHQTAEMLQMTEKQYT